MSVLHCFLSDIRLYSIQKKLVNRSSNWSCTRGMIRNKQCKINALKEKIHNKIHLISPGCPRPSIALQCKIMTHLKHHPFDYSKAKDWMWHKTRHNPLLSVVYFTIFKWHGNLEESFSYPRSFISSVYSSKIALIDLNWKRWLVIS